MAYLAGIFDGEGCTGLFKRSDRPSLKPRVQVNMTNKAVIDLFAETFGGKVRFRPRAKPHHQDQWTWSIHTKAARDCLTQMMPFLIVKKEAALVVIDYNSEPRKRGRPAKAPS